MKIAIIGAGFAGLSAAKVLRQFDHDVTVFEKVDDVGGVWSKTRRYPGLSTQNVKDTYSLSDLPMPREYPEYLMGEHVQAYLADYANKFVAPEDLRLGTEVVSADLNEVDQSWNITSRVVATGQEQQETFDQLVVANGIFSEPFTPSFEGEQEYKAAGGIIRAVSESQTLDDVRGKDVLVVGFGKSACDIAVELSQVARSTTVVARNLLWKLPKKVGNVVPYKYLFLTRMGEGLIKYHTPKGFEKFLHGPGKPMRNSMLGSVQGAVTRQLKLKKHGLLPEGGFERIARSTVSLATDGFYEAVDSGKIKVTRDTQINRLLVNEGKLEAKLSNGETVAADAVICGTGWNQTVPFFKPELLQRLTNAEGDYELYQYILPHDVPNLFFVGYNSSFFSPLSAETAALWVAAYLDGQFQIPPVEQRRKKVSERLAWMKERTHGKHARGTNLIPFSMHNIDETLDEIGINVGVGTRFKQWLLPPNPSSYRKVTQKLLRRHQQMAGK